MSSTLFASGYDGKIHTLSFTPSSKSFSITSSTSAGKAPTWLTLSPTHRILYTGDEFSQPNGQVASFKINDDSSLSRLGGGRTVETKEGPVHFAISRDGKQLFAACYAAGALSSVWLKEDGTFDEERKGQTFVYGGKGVNKERQEGPHAHGVAIDPTGEYLFCTDLGTDQLHIYKISEDRIDLHRSVVTPRGGGPRHVVFSRPSPSSSSRTLVYLVAEMGNSVSIYEIVYPPPEAPEGSAMAIDEQPVPKPDPDAEDVKPNVVPEEDVKPVVEEQDFVDEEKKTPKKKTKKQIKEEEEAAKPKPPPPPPRIDLNPVQTSISILPPDSSKYPGDWTAAEIELSVDGKLLYVSNRGPEDVKNAPRQDSMTIFELNEEGLIVEANTTHVPLGGRGARHFMFSPSSSSVGEGKFVAVAHQRTNEVVVFESNGKELNEVARVGGIEGATCVIWG